MHSSQLKDLKSDDHRFSNRKKIVLPDEETEEQQPNNVRILELEAEALAL